ncbi:tetratricopeptide repeat protein [Chitinimonas sp.]|uniref:tetratricopeptide repeat protein n=1 Tax=Chitinimonas sp. TaxID=1934313 RepID=UPI002F94FD93
MSTTLPAILQEPIQALLDEGDKLFDKGKFDAALQKYEEARALLPSDLERWEASTWVLAAIGDVCFLKGDHQAAQAAMQLASNCPEGATNPFIQLRLGQAEFELGKLDQAVIALSLAFATGGEEVFEDEDPKYRAQVVRP